MGKVIMRNSAILACGCLSLAIAAATAGCVRRTMTINTEPQGASVWLNDEEIGRTPVSVDFQWYGDYDVVARLAEYETLRTHQQINAPWYQTPGIDFVAEVLYPGWIVDARELHFELSPESLPTRDELLDNAKDMRELALSSDDDES